MSEETTENTGHTGGAYQVLARKYRPQNFDDLIGHGPMVRTLRNAFSTGRIAHAYVLTGVRGVGKTTTARILARALNYVSADGTDNGPSIDMVEEGLHCKAIAESRHPDVLEMDAASRTGVGDIRELIEGVRYAPVEARYKVYIIDEVHMLSTAAFNALLKTLEEPPPHVKFIFATTEIRKLPVTVLSRCQRFDLRRIEPDVLTEHLKSIASKEGVVVEDDGLWLIARAAEGSVRDGLSILDQALIQHGREENSPVSAETIRDMLGLADRGQIWDLLEVLMKGDAKQALELFRIQYDAGADPSVVLRDLLELVHLLTRVKAAGPTAAGHGAAGEADAARAKEISAGLEVNVLTRAWNLLMKGLQETQSAPDAAASAEITMIKLAFAADLPTPDEALRLLKEGAPAGMSDNAAGGPPPRPGGGNGATAVAGGGVARALAADPAPKPSNAPQAHGGPRLDSFADVVRLAGAKRDAKLKVELESYVHLISFEQGRIALRLNEKAPPDLAGRLVQRLKEWTKSVWTVTVDSEETGAATLRDARYAEVMAHPVVKQAFELFPDAEIVAIREPDLSETDIGMVDDRLTTDPDEDDDGEE